MIIDSYSALPIDASTKEVNAMRDVEAGALLADGRWSKAAGALDQHLQNVLNEVKRVSAETPDFDRVVAPVVARLQERIARVDCNRCARGVPPCGPDRASNHVNLANGGEWQARRMVIRRQG